MNFEDGLCFTFCRFLKHQGTNKVLEIKTQLEGFDFEPSGVPPTAADKF